MGIIKVRTPSGVIQVRIAGEAPTEEESRAISQSVAQLGTGPSVDAELGGVGKPNLARMSTDEIREYARMRQQAGITPSGEKMTADEYADVYREEGVDYTQGLQDTGNFSRFGYGRMDTDKERENYLRSTVGEGGFRKDALGRFVLTQKGRQNLGMEAGQDLAIDEEGLSWGDFKEFMGQAALPTAAGIGAGLIASGVGFVPGVLIAGGAAAAGKALDEGIESAQGLQDQTFQDVMRDSAFEGLFSATGEGLGRGVSSLFGRLIKGPGGAENEVLRQQARELLDRNFRPTVAGATDEGFRPILNRLQSVYEAVFPNKKAATQNLDNIVSELRSLRTMDPAALDDLSDVVRRDIDNLYSTADEQLLKAQNTLNTTVTDEIGRVMSALRRDGVVPKDLAEVLQLRKRIFDENLDSVFSKTSQTLRGQAIVPTAGIKKELDRLVNDSAADIGGTKFARMVSGLPEFATVQDVTRIRTALADASYSPSLVADVNVGALGALRSSITAALNDTEISLARAVGMPVEEGMKILGPKDFTASFKEMSDALGTLRRANGLYRAGMKRFDNVVTQSIMKQAQKGQLNERFIFDQIIQKDNPEAFRQLMKAVRGAKFMEGLPAGERTARQQLVNGMPIERARAEMNLLPQNSQARRLLAQEIRRVETRATEAQAARRVGAEAAEGLRQDLARMYLGNVMSRSRVIDPATGAELIDPVKFSANMREKGSVFDELFRGEKKQLNDLLAVMERGKADLAPSVIDDIMSRNQPLAESLTGLRRVQAERAALDKDRFIRALGEGDTGTIAKEVLRSKANIDQAKSVLSPEAFDGVRDAAMGRILQQADIATTAGGQVKMTDDFIEAFRSGRLGDRLQGIVNSYGDETLDQLFGPGTAKAMNTIAADMIKTSNASIAGKGGLAAPQIALGLGMVSILTNPLATLPTAAAYMVMSKALRNKTVLKALMASRQPNSIKQFLSGKFKANDPIAQGLQVMNQLVAQALVQGGRGAAVQGEQETQAMQALTQRQAQAARQNEGVNQMLSDLGQVGQQAMQTVTSPIQALTQTPQAPSSAAAARVNPILVPNPATRAALGG
jgi:hypothetical protein